MKEDWVNYVIPDDYKGPDHVCPVDKDYDHKAVRDAMPESIRNEVCNILAEQIRSISRHIDPIEIRCGGLVSFDDGGTERCTTEAGMLYMFRCWFCGRWLCPACAKLHFGER